MSAGTPTWFTAMLVLSMLVTACRHSGSGAPSLPSDARPPAASVVSTPMAGEVAVEFLADPDSPKPKLSESQEFTPASPRFTPLPEYPPETLAGGGPSAVIAVRLVLGGPEIEVKDSPKLARYTGPYASEFRAAVEAAVRRWSFTAARIDTPGPPRPDMPERYLMATRYVPTYLDFAFRFSVVEGRGVVSVGPDSPTTATTPPERVK